MNKLLFLYLCIRNLPMDLQICLGLFIYLVASWIIILPILYNCMIIPHIEKRLGLKLEFSSISYKYQKNLFPIFGKYLAAAGEVAFYLFLKFLILLITKKPEKVSLRNNALQKVNYEIRDASSLEILSSLIFFINWILAIFLCAYVLIVPA